jgi:hypothetical protein
MKKKTLKKPVLFRLIRNTVKLVTPKYQVEIQEALDPSGSIFVSNHAKTNGPIGLQLYFPGPKKIWVIGQMCNLREVPDYAMDDFWRNKHWTVKWFFRLFSYVIAPLSAFIMKHADTIPVYKDMRIKITFKETSGALASGENVIIFPEYREPDNEYLNKFQHNFVDCAKLYYLKTKKLIKFYHVYVCRDLKKIIIGPSTVFNPENDMEKERLRISGYLSEAIVSLAKGLPQHRIVHYNDEQDN